MSRAMPIPSVKPGLALRVLLAIIAVMAIVVPAVIVLRAPPVVPHRHLRLPPARVVPKAELPPVEPVALADMSMDEARAFNASIPFVGGPYAAARPLVLGRATQNPAPAIDIRARAKL